MFKEKCLKHGVSIPPHCCCKYCIEEELKERGRLMDGLKDRLEELEEKVNRKFAQQRKF